MRSLGATPIRKFSRSVVTFVLTSDRLFKQRMKFLNFVRTESYVSLVEEEEEISKPEPRSIPSYVFGVDTEGEYLRIEGTKPEEENFFVERRIESDR